MAAKAAAVHFFYEATMNLDFEPLDLSEINKEAQRVSEDSAASGGASDYLEKFVKMPERDGYVLLRIMPRKNKNTQAWCLTRVHTLTNPETRAKKTYHCPRNPAPEGRRGYVGDCIICKYYSDLWAKSEKVEGKAKEDLQRQAREIKPVERYYFNVIVRSEKDKDGNLKKNVGPKIFSCGKTTYSKIMNAMRGDEAAGLAPLGDITHPLNGRDFRVVKKVVKGGGGLEYPNYDNSKFEDPTPAGSIEDIKTWLDNLHDLQALRALKSADELKHALKVHLGMVKDGPNSNDADLEELRGYGGSAPKQKPAETIREELAVSSTPPVSKEKASSKVEVEDETELADDDFLKGLAGM